jgi:hypothetical protein
MPSDLTVPRIAATTAVSGERSPAVPARPPAAEGLRPAGSALPNPTLRLDPGLAMVVIEFRDESGAVRTSIPSQQQLDAYRAWQRSKTGPPPAAPGVEGPAPAPAAAPAVKDAETPAREDGGSPS